VTEAFVTKWNQRVPKIRRWQLTGACLIALDSLAALVHTFMPGLSVLY